MKKLNKESRLLKLIFEHFGGYSEVARRFNVSRQVVFSWVIKGGVPRARLRTLSEAFGVPTAALNYKIYRQVTSNPKDFEAYIKCVKDSFR